MAAAVASVSVATPASTGVGSAFGSVVASVDATAVASVGVASAAGASTAGTVALGAGGSVGMPVTAVPGAAAGVGNVFAGVPSSATGGTAFSFVAPPPRPQAVAARERSIANAMRIDRRSLAELHDHLAILNLRPLDPARTEAPDQ
ncbi:hypothetical protein [Lysobacter sp. TY2-98]|uniref:hypothetical protein n=1 Tax=Lysobacter sp. TY2-98 TaxID=2290922 RepID=UPI0013B4197B|nr:hypothetical protein [Lysobacter sp. TY2-98]